MIKAKPFVKWAGGKGQLLEQLDELLPKDFDKMVDATYIEPFVGGGAMLFHMLQKYPNIKFACICDINQKLIKTYKVVRDNPEELIAELHKLENEFLSLSTIEEKQEYYLKIRENYNKYQPNQIQVAAFFIFLNKTCFNGIYRENKSGKFNVPFNKVANPQICNDDIIRADSELLKKVVMIDGDYKYSLGYAYGNALLYFDPPYRPINPTSSFNDYTKEGFNDESQKNLKKFCDLINERGCKFMLSNSDCSAANPNDLFFEDLYLKDTQYNIKRVYAARSINSVASKRGKLTEIVVRNFK